MAVCRGVGVARSRKRVAVLACAIVLGLGVGNREVHAQRRDPLLNGAVIGAAIGAASGVALTHAVRDSDLTAGQYARGAVIFGAIGAGAGLGIDALFSRTSPRPSRRPLVIPAVGRHVKAVAVKWKW